MDLVERIKADESKLARYGRAFLLWAGAVAAQVLATPGGLDAAALWTPKRWALGIIVAALFGSAGLISVGQKNPPATP